MNFPYVSKIYISATIYVLGPSATICKEVLKKVFSYELLFFYFHLLFAPCPSRGLRYTLDNYEKVKWQPYQILRSTLLVIRHSGLITICCASHSHTEHFFRVAIYGQLSNSQRNTYLYSMQASRVLLLNYLFVIHINKTQKTGRTPDSSKCGKYHSSI